ncbi:hypothetical protein D9758_004506 [Tetrapyrgos nigripes]|uniref:Uncharacterized protein n=1 Tax=Tetrapyrgos nigripes TaxID=182062 RepID=A0A8H5GMZ5_9AGAR|nr:hypothetical protein D9758_004506 [Tetrapyrgos nigripes]
MLNVQGQATSGSTVPGTAAFISTAISAATSPIANATEAAASQDTPTKRKGLFERVKVVRNMDCRGIVVAKDHFDSTADNAVIAFGKWKAIKSPNYGSIFLNPGDLLLFFLPFYCGYEINGERGQALAKLLGDNYDLIGFDPRRIGNTVPATRCFPSPVTNALFFTDLSSNKASLFPQSLICPLLVFIMD